MEEDVRMNLLSFLGAVYSRTAVGYKRLSLVALLASMVPELSQRSAFIRAMFSLGVLVPQSGNRHSPVHWNLEVCGPPSLELVEKIQCRAEAIRKGWYEQRMRTRARRLTDKIVLTAMRSGKGCRHCRYIGTDMCKFFASLGFRCQEYDLSTLKMEDK